MRLSRRETIIGASGVVAAGASALAAIGSYREAEKANSIINESNKKAEKANEMASKANQKAEQANEVAEEANDIAEEANSIERTIDADIIEFSSKGGTYRLGQGKQQ